MACLVQHYIQELVPQTLHIQTRSCDCQVTQGCHTHSGWSLTFLLSSGRLREERSRRFSTCSKERCTSSQSSDHAVQERTSLVAREQSRQELLTFTGRSSVVVAISDI